MENNFLEPWENLLRNVLIPFEKSTDNGYEILKATMTIYVPSHEETLILVQREVELELKATEEGVLKAELAGGTIHMSNVHPDLAVQYFLCERKLHHIAM